MWLAGIILLYQWVRRQIRDIREGAEAWKQL